MAVNSVLGKTKVSSALIQTSEARSSSLLIIMEIFLISCFVGAAFDSFLTGFLLTFLILIFLIDTILWVIFTYFVSGALGFLAGQISYSTDGSLLSAFVIGIFIFSLMIGWHHWGLSYWRGLSD